MTKLPPVAWLQAFEAAARNLSFTRAGEELHVSQSAISQRIRLLEAHVGQPLFVRHAHSITLTETGRAWLPSIEAAFLRLTQGTAEVFGPGSAAPVTLRTTPALQHYWLAPRLASLQRSAPEIGIHVVSAVWEEDFGGDDVDIEICYGRSDRADVIQQSLGAEGMLPLCAPAIAARLSSAADLGEHTLLHVTGFAVGWSAWLALAGAAEVESQARAFWCDTQIMTLRMAEQGCGIALAHRRLVDRGSTLIAPFELQCPTDAEFWLMRPARKRMRESARRVWEFLAAG